MKKVFIDSNIIIRLIVKDELNQLRKAQQLIKQIEDDKLQGVLSILVVNEIIWILEHYYDLQREKYIPFLLKLMSLKNIKIFEAKKDVIIDTLRRMRKQKFDFTDIYLAHVTTQEKIFSFDKDFKKLFK